MSPLSSRHLLIALLLTWLAPSLAHGQADRDAIKRRNDCRLAVQVIETGHPAPHKEWAWKYVTFCEPAQRVEAYLAAMQQARSSTDLSFVRTAFLPVAAFRDGMLLDQVLSVAGDRSASIPARVVAFMALASILDPRASPTYEGFIGGFDEYGLPRGGCSRRLAHPIASVQGPAAFPSDYRERIAALAERVARDTSETADVRSAATCA